MMRVVVGGAALDGLTITEPAASVRLLVPWPGEPFALPVWNGNEFLAADGRRPALRTFTPVHQVDDRLWIDIVRHPGGAVSGWAETANAGDPCAISGPGRGETIDDQAKRYVLVGDETAIPAVEQLLAVIPATTAVEVHLEITEPAARLALPRHPRATVDWHLASPDRAPGTAMDDAVRATDLDDDTRIWVAGEAAAVQAIRRHLFEQRGVARSRATVRGYWKTARLGRVTGAP